MLLAAVVIASALLTGCLFAPEKSSAARGMELALQDDSIFLNKNKYVSHAKAFKYARQLGVTRLRVNLLWAYTMTPNVYQARRKPAQIPYFFNVIDTLIDEAADNGIRVHLSLTGPAPRWARPKPMISQAWYKPNTREFGKWAGIVAEHFKGRVDRYSIWNEPNWRTWLGPLKSAPGLYRSLYTKGYAAIKKADPRAKVLIGETSPNARAGLSTAPLAFLRNYFAHGGIGDGLPGFIISALNAYYVFLKFAKLWELDRVQGSGFRVQGSFLVHEHRTSNPEPRTQNPERERTLNPEP